MEDNNLSQVILGAVYLVHKHLNGRAYASGPTYSGVIVTGAHDLRTALLEEVVLRTLPPGTDTQIVGNIVSQLYDMAKFLCEEVTL